MKLILSWHSDVERDIESAMVHDKAEEAARLRQGLEAGIRVMESWVLRSGGRMLGLSSSIGAAEMEAEHLDELPDVVSQFEHATEARMQVGVGAEPSEAEMALRAAKKHGGDPAVTLYTPDLGADDVEDDDELTEGEAEALEENDAGMLADAGDQPFLGKAQFNEPRPAGEATQIQQGDLSPTAAQPSPPPSASFSAPVQPQAQPGGQAPAQPGPGEPENEDQVLQAVGAVLKDFKAQLPFFEQQVKQANPQAYQSVMGMVQAMIAMAQSLSQGGPESTPPPEAGGPQQEQPVAKAEVDMPPGHKAGMKVPEGGSCCANCKFLKKDGLECGEKHWVEWHDGDPVIPAPADEYCCDMYKAQGELEKDEKTETEPHEKMPSPEHLAKLYRAAVKSMMEKGELEATMPEPFNMGEYVEGWYHERGEHPHLDDHATTMTVLQHLKEHPEYYSKLRTVEESGALDKEEVAAHVAHTYPVGSVTKRGIKVVEPVTGKVSWHQARAGRKMSGDGHAISARLGECPTADTPETRLAQAGLQGGQDPNAAPPSAQSVTLPGAK